MHDLKRELLAAWEMLTVTYLQNLYNTLPRRYWQVLACQRDSSQEVMIKVGFIAFTSVLFRQLEKN